jgi:hypothetical protein
MKDRLCPINRTPLTRSRIIRARRKCANITITAAHLLDKQLVSVPKLLLKAWIRFEMAMDHPDGSERAMLHLMKAGGW